MNKKGFTLIELLAVIVILAIIALIAIPTILGVIDKAKKGAFKASVLGVMESGELYITRNMDNYDSSSELTFTCNGVECVNDQDETKKLEFKGDVPISGQLVIKPNGKMESNYLRNETYYALGTRDNLVIEKNGEEIDTTQLELALTSVKVTTNEIIINVEAIAGSSGIKSIQYEINDKIEVEDYNLETSINKNKKFEKLEKNKEYKIVVTITSGNNKQISKDITIKTSDMGTVAVKFTNNPEETKNDYLKSQIATIEYNGIDLNNPYYYVKTDRVAESSATAYSCGTGTVPLECSAIDSITNLEVDVWYRYENIPTITYNQSSDTTGTIYVAVGDGNNIITSNGIISKIDVDTPTLTLKTPILTATNITIPFTVKDTQSGIERITCKYGTTKDDYTNNATSIDETNCVIDNIASGSTYYVQLCSYDFVGNNKCNNTIIPTVITISQTNTPTVSVNGYLQKQQWRLSSTQQYIYVKTTRAATIVDIVGGTAYKCGTGSIPDSCNAYSGHGANSTVNLEENVWYRFVTPYYAYNGAGTPLMVTYDQDDDSTATIYAAMGNDDYTSEVVYETVSKIDTTSPTISVSSAVYDTSGNLNVGYKITENYSGIEKITCKFGKSGGTFFNPTEPTSYDYVGKATTTSCTYSGFSGTPYYSICVTDKIGNSESCVTGALTKSSGSIA